MSTDDWEREGFTPEGPGPYRQFMEIRVFDCWYHDQDIREALGRPGYLEGPVADLSLGRIPPKGLGYVVGKKAGAPPGTHRRVRSARAAADRRGDLGAPGRARGVARRRAPDDPTVRIATDRRTFARLAGGRWTGDQAREQGAVRVDGDTELGNRIVDNMAFTI